MNPSTCLICGAIFWPSISFGRQPIANAFRATDRSDPEFFYDLTVGLCPRCHMVQLGQIVDKSKLFHDEYAFFSGTSKGMASHFADLATELRERHLNATDPFVVEVGSNDGILLKHFADRGIRHLGVEPSANVAAAARDQGVATVCRFFDERLAGELLAENGPADVVFGANVISHIADLPSVVRGARKLLKPTGVFIFEDPYVDDIVGMTAFDQFYDEHVFYFSVLAIDRVMSMYDMELSDVERQPVHGGSMRYTARPRGSGQVSPQVAEALEREQAAGVGVLETYEALRDRIATSRNDLVTFLRRAREQGKRVVGYGATSKSTTVTNYCGITSDLVEYISDTTPIKQGKLNPGTHIPVRPYEAFQEDPPDFALLFAWNHANEILEKERSFVANGGRFVVYVPRVGLLP